MNCKRTVFGLLLPALIGVAVVPAAAEVFFQCPTRAGGSFVGSQWRRGDPRRHPGPGGA